MQGGAVMTAAGFGNGAMGAAGRPPMGAGMMGRGGRGGGAAGAANAGFMGGMNMSMPNPAASHEYGREHACGDESRHDADDEAPDWRSRWDGAARG